MLKLEENQMKMIELKKELKLAKYETSVAIKRYELLQGKMFANIGDVIVIIAKDGITKYKSPNLEKWFGWKPEEVVGKSIWENIYPDDLEHVKNFIGTLKEKYDAAGKIEFRYQCKNGRYKWIEFTAVNLLYDPDILGILGNYHDITERIQAEKQFRLLSRAIEQSPVTIVITDKEGNIEYANPKFTEVTGFSMDEVEGKNPRFLQSGKQTREFYNDLWNRISSGKNWYGEFHNRKKNGDLFWESAVISPIMDVTGDIAFFLAIKEDITEKKKMIEDLINAKEKAEENDRLKSAFLANISHEIRTPMNGILGFADLLKDPDISGEDQKEYISIIEKSGARMLNIINDIVDISKIESGQVKVSLSETNINEQIEYIFSFFKPMVEQRGILFSVKNSLQANEANIYTDQEKLYVILSNLIKNALKFTKEGSIEIGYNLSTISKQAELIFYIKDTGIGIFPEKLNIIFERFRQGEESNSRNYEGAGLGLSISKAYVEMLGGKIWVESENGKGSTFYFTLPYNGNHKVKNECNNLVLAESEEKPVTRLKILIAEDDEGGLKFLKLAVKMISKEIISVQNGVEAVKACHDNPDIDLILMDIQMPEMDGYEATRQIRQFNTNVVIIAQTAIALNGDNKRAMEAGCNDYISKPIKKAQLMKLMERYL